jgi:hypothetical protein
VPVLWSSPHLVEFFGLCCAFALELMRQPHGSRLSPPRCNG